VGIGRRDLHRGAQMSKSSLGKTGGSVQKISIDRFLWSLCPIAEPAIWRTQRDFN